MAHRGRGIRAPTPRVALARVLLEHDVSPEHTMAILAVVMEVTGSDVADVQPAVRRTEEALRLGHPTEGASTIREVLGQDVGQRALVAIARMLQFGAVDATTGVVMDGGRLAQIVDCAELALVRGGAPIYQRGGSLIRPVKLPHVGHASADDEIQRDPEATVLLAVREPWLIEQMSQTLTWFQRRGRRACPGRSESPLCAYVAASGGVAVSCPRCCPDRAHAQP